jgi:hypothetical protein
VPERLHRELHKAFEKDYQYLMLRGPENRDAVTDSGKKGSVISFEEVLAGRYVKMYISVREIKHLYLQQQKWGLTTFYPPVQGIGIRFSTLRMHEYRSQCFGLIIFGYS